MSRFRPNKSDSTFLPKNGVLFCAFTPKHLSRCFRFFSAASAKLLDFKNDYYIIIADHTVTIISLFNSELFSGKSLLYTELMGENLYDFTEIETQKEA